MPRTPKATGSPSSPEPKEITRQNLIESMRVMLADPELQKRVGRREAERMRSEFNTLTRDQKRPKPYTDRTESAQTGPEGSTNTRNR